MSVFALILVAVFGFTRQAGAATVFNPDGSCTVKVTIGGIAHSYAGTTSTDQYGTWCIDLTEMATLAVNPTLGGSGPVLTYFNSVFPPTSGGATNQ